MCMLHVTLGGKERCGISWCRHYVEGGVLGGV